MNKSFILAATLLAGCATADSVQELKAEIAELKTQVESLQNNPGAKTASAKTGKGKTPRAHQQ